MNAIACELCGSNDVVKQGDYFVCQHCGTKYTLEDAKKLIGTVKIDNSEDLENLFVLARRAKDEGNYENAQKYYEMILLKEPNNWEAHFYSVYSKCAQCTVNQIVDASSTLESCLDNVLRLIKENIDDEIKQAEAIGEVRYRCAAVVKVFIEAIWTRPNFQGGGYIETERDKSVCQILSSLRQGIERYFSSNGNVSFLIASLQNEENLRRTEREKYASIIRNHGNGGGQQGGYSSDGYGNKQQGCYVATAVYGSYNCPQVWTLRRYRDYTLAETWYGRVFIHTYYAISPTLVKWFGKTQWFKNMWKPKLDKMVKRLNEEGVANTPYQDRQW